MSEVVNGSFDVDYLKDMNALGSLHFLVHCWDRPAGLKAVNLCVGTWPYGSDVSIEALERIDDLPRLLPKLALKAGIQYFLTIEVEDKAGWRTRRTSDGFTIDLVSVAYFLPIPLLNNRY
jgi:hypothetical protein